jgi:hypothetical protein
MRDGLTMSWFEAFVAELARSGGGVSGALADGVTNSYLNEMPYCETLSKPLFHTSVTSQALVADNRHERKAETALPPTRQILRVSWPIAMRKRGVGDGGEGTVSSARAAGCDIWMSRKKWSRSALGRRMEICLVLT